MISKDEIENCKRLVFQNNNEELHLYGLQLNKALGLNVINKEWRELMKISKKSIWDILTGFLDLIGTNITSLPDNLSVGGNLYLIDTNITSLPDNLSVGGFLYLTGTNITSLPDNLSVGGNLHLTGTKITSLPDNLSVGGNLHLRGTNITSLPDNLSVGGNLHLRGTKITNRDKIPKHLIEKCIF